MKKINELLEQIENKGLREDIRNEINSLVDKGGTIERTEPVEPFYKRYEKMSENEKKLYEKVALELDELFDDMCFDSESTAGKAIACQIQDDDGSWVDTSVSLPLVIESFEWNKYKFEVKELADEIGGFCNPKTNTLCINEKWLDEDHVIIHEMIHVYEDVINKAPMFYHDTLLWCLYMDLKKQIPNLDDIITDHCHILHEQCIDYRGGLHDTLFLLKSLDLDIRKGYPLGTVFGYSLQSELTDTKVQESSSTPSQETH